MRRLSPYWPKVRMVMDWGDYMIKTVEHEEELFRALQLRHGVFYQELLRQSVGEGVDLDEYDVLCDHLVVIERRTEEVMGTYRLNASIFSNRFYSEKEFILDELLSRPGAKVELGRACVRQDHRTGRIFNLLWKGIFHYVQSIGARYVFGCSSVPTVNLQEISRIGQYFLQRGLVADEYGVVPRRKLPPDAWPQNSSSSSPAQAPAIPALLLFYLKGGARVVRQPAIDHDFRCADFLTVLDMDRVHPSFQRYFSRC